MPDEIVNYDGKSHEHLIPTITSIHSACIQHDKAALTFRPPLDEAKMLKYWRKRLVEIDSSEMIMLLYFVSPGDAGEKQLAGYIAVSLPDSETGPFRASVEKLLVAPEYRGRGIARKLVARMEKEARDLGRTYLKLATETGSAAEKVYLKLGYTKWGILPNHVLSVNGELTSDSFFYKNLKLMPPLRAPSL